MKIEINRKVKIVATHEDWQLFDQPGVEEAAEDLNRILGCALSVPDPHLIDYQSIYEGLDKYADYGACDSEGFAFVRRCVREVFGLVP